MKQSRFTKGNRITRRTVVRSLASGIGGVKVLPQAGSVTRTALQEDPGDEKSEALQIKPGQEVHTTIGPCCLPIVADEDDWFEFDVTTGDEIRVDFHESPPAIARLIGPDDAVLDSEGHFPDRLTGRVSQSGTGYIHVTDPPGGANSTYSFTLSVSSTDDDGTGDGTDGDVDDDADDTEDAVRLSNDRVTVTFDRTDHDSRIYLSSFRLQESGRELLGERSLRFRSVAPDEEVLTHERTDDIQLTSGDNWDGYVLHRTFAFDESRVVTISQTVKLFDFDPYVIIETTLENTGTDPVVMNQPEINIHRGWRTAAYLELAEPVSPPRFHVGRSGTFAFEDVGQWQTFPFTGEIPFVTLFDEEDGLAYRQLDGQTLPEMAITERDDEQYLSYAVRGPSLAPGQEAHYAAVLGGHNGGQRAVEEAQRLVRVAMKRV